MPESKLIKNRIAYLEHFLFTRPPEQVYMGDSEYAESAVEQENQQNELLAEEAQGEIVRLKDKLKQIC